MQYTKEGQLPCLLACPSTPLLLLHTPDKHLHPLLQYNSCAFP